MQRPFTRRFFSFLAILLVAHVPLSCRATQTSSDGSWELGISVLDADLSPDDQFVAFTRESPQNPKRGDRVDEWVELWDFRKNLQAGKAHIATYTVGWSARRWPVRFTSDGRFVVAVSATAIVVFDAGTLNLVRTIQLAGLGAFDIRRFEISPVSHTAVLASRGGELFAVDLDSGDALFTGRAATSIPSEVTSISWKLDGSQFAVALPAPCSNRGEIQVFGGNPIARLKALHSKNVSAVAFSADRLFAVQISSCKGSVFNKHLGMNVFSTKTWTPETTIFLSNQDLHDSVFYSEGRLLANSGLVRSSFDALDLTTSSSPANVQLTLWGGDARSIIYVSSAIPIRGLDVRLRLSRTGKVALIVDSSVRLIQLP